MTVSEFSTVRPVLSQHADIRAQQRGIPRDVLDILLRYGRQEHDHMGGLVVTFDAHSLERVMRQEPASTWRRVSESRSLYAVIDISGHVITAGHRYRRLIRDRSLSFFRTATARNRTARSAFCH